MDHRTLFVEVMRPIVVVGRMRADHAQRNRFGCHVATLGTADHTGDPKSIARAYWLALVCHVGLAAKE